MRIATDMDGVLATESWLQYIGWEVNKYFGMWCMNKAKVLHRPYSTDFFIITGRSMELKDLTEKWLNKNGIIYRELVLNYTFGIVQGIHHKWQSIETYNIDIYIESDYATGKLLEALTNRCTILTPQEAIERKLIV